MEKEEEEEEDTTFRKLFIGGLSYNTSETGLRDYFLQFGAVAEANVVYDRHGRSKGYGFVTFINPEDAATACQNRSHIIDGRTVNCNLAAFPDEISQRSSRNRAPRMYFGPPAPHSSSFPVVPNPLPYTNSYWSPNYPMYGPAPMYVVPSVDPCGQSSGSDQPLTSNNPMHGPGPMYGVPLVYTYGQASCSNALATSNNPMHGPGPMYGVPPVYPYGQYMVLDQCMVYPQFIHMASCSNAPVTSNNPMYGPGSVPPVYPYGQTSGRNEPANGNTPVVIDITCNATENDSPMSGPPSSGNSSVQQDSS